MADAESEMVEVGRMSDLYPYLPAIVRGWHPDPGPNGSVLEVNGTLLSADLSGFTALSERLTRLGREGAEELTNLLNACFDGMIGHMSVEGGDVLKFGGDALLVLFTGEEHAARACRAAFATRSFIREPLRGSHGAVVRLRISQGLHSGQFHLFALRGNHVEVLISGPGATETVTCESIASPGEILLSASTAGLIDPGCLGAPKEGRWLLRRLPANDKPALDRDAESGRDVDGGVDDVETYIPVAQREQILARVVGEHRRVTVAFLKFAHTDRLIEDPGAEALAARLAALARVVAQSERHYGVHWLATDIYADGGKFILTAGAPVSSGSDEDAMLGAIRDVLDAGIELDLSAGTNAGQVFVGDVGSGSRRTFTVMGDAVNLAARLMQKAGTGELLASQAVCEVARSPFELEQLPPFLVKGKTQSINAAAVGQRLSSDARSTSQYRLVGRDDEQAKLRGAVDLARGGRGSVIDIVGEPGIGKTRLVDELRTSDGIRSIGVICGRYAQASPYFAARLLLRTATGIEPQSTPEEAGEALKQLVVERAPQLEPWIPLLAIPLAAHVPATSASDAVAPNHRRGRSHQLMVELLTEAVRMPTAFIVDDAHWIDDASRDLIETLAAAASERPWILCTSRRPGEATPFNDLQDCIRIDLGPLSDQSLRALAGEVGGGATALLPDEWDRIVQHAAGNPLFVIELVSSASAAGDTGLPQSIDAIVTSRMDTLPATDRQLLRNASAMGMFVEADVLADALGDERIRPAGRWSRLDPFLRTAGPGQFFFRQEIYQQAAYEGLSYRHRRDIHRHLGERLERRGGVDPQLLSVHFSRAGDHRRAWRYAIDAAAQARQTYANVESAALYRRALESARFLPDLPPGEVVDAYEALGDACELGARYLDAAAAYAHARLRLSRLGGESETALPSVRLCRKSGSVDERRGRYSQALRWYGRGLRLAGDMADNADTQAVQAQLKLAYAGVRYRQGRYREMLRWTTEAAAHAEACHDRSALGHAYFLLDLAYASIGTAERDSYAARALKIFEELDDQVGLSRSLNNLGISAWRSGHWDKSLDLFERSRAAYERSGDVVGAAMAANNAAEILSDQGRLQEAMTVLRTALHTCRSARYPSGTAVILGNLGQAEARAGNRDEGLMLLDESIDLLKELGAAGYELEAAVKRKEALALAGRFDDVLDHSRELLLRLDASEEDVLGAALQRHRGLAFRGLGLTDDALQAIDDAVARAEAAHAGYELGQALLARADLLTETDEVHRKDQERGLALLEGMGVVVPVRA